MKHIDNNKKNFMRNEKLNKFTGIIEKIKTINLPSLPPIIVNENNVNDSINVMIEEISFKMMKMRAFCMEIIFMKLRIKLNRNKSLKRSFEIIRNFMSQ